MRTPRKQTQGAPRYAECEGSFASPTSLVHLRTLADGEELQTGGGLRVSTLCGRDLAGGWDVRVVTIAEVDRLAGAMRPGQPGAICPRCAGATRTQVDGGEGERG